MKRLRITSLSFFLIILAAISAGYLHGVAGVPFHPDESSYLYMSGDLDTLFRTPSALFWRPELAADPRQHYRLLDPPLVHILPGLGRWVAGLPALPVDWNWSKTWLENQQAGALPSPELLLAGRMAVAALFPFSALFLFLAARRVTNDFTAWAAALLLASNALVLLHTRRSMAEGGLLFTLTLSMWALVKAEKRPWLTGIPAALAFCAKQSLAALAPAGLLAVLLSMLPVKGAIPEERAGNRMQRLMGQILLFGITFAAVIFLLNPFLWGQPVPAVQAAIRSRQELAGGQTADRQAQALDTPGLRLVGLIGSVYVTPPAFAETGNYLDDTRAAEMAYLANPLHSLFRSIPAGAILLAASLFGFIVSGVRVARTGHPARRGLILLLVASLLQVLALLALVPLPWQRYYLPVVPYTCLWTAVAVDQLKELVSRAVYRRVTPAQVIR